MKCDPNECDPNDSDDDSDDDCNCFSINSEVYTMKFLDTISSDRRRICMRTSGLSDRGVDH